MGIGYDRASFSRGKRHEMKILVGIKRVVDYTVRVQVKPDGSGVAIEGAKMSMNPFCEIALEEALRLKEAGKATEVVVATIGQQTSMQQIDSGLAMGAQRGILVKTDTAPQPLTVARVFQKLVEQEKPQIVLLGKQAIDDDAGQTGQMLAALLGWSQATFASKVEIDGTVARVTREVDAGLETLECDLPCVITVDLRLNTPRFIKLPDIMKAKSKPRQTLELASLGVENGDHLKTTQYAPPPKRSRGVMVKDVPELVAALKNKGLL
jgi:electron transfer flavoprotein beta subunit